MTPVKKSLVKDWQAVRDKIVSFPWAGQIARKLKSETDRWIEVYEDDADRVAGWGHHFFCSVCFSPLVFDPHKPDEHRCSRCGAVRQDSDACEAWCSTYRSRSGVQLFHAAVMYNLYGDQGYLVYIRKVLSFCSDHFTSFRVRTPSGFEGRFSGINLNDAVTLCWMLNGLELVREQFTDEELERYKHNFFFPMADFLDHKAGGTPNICCWMKSALGMIGLFFGEPEWCRRAADGKEGIKAQLAQGLLPQGFWYESSFHYHFYCAEGLTYYAAFCELHQYDFAELTESVRKMYRYPLLYAFPNGRFPSPNDGWPQLSFADYAHQYEWIRNIYDEAPFRYALGQCYEEPGNENEDARSIGGLPRLLFGTDWRSELSEAERKGEASIRPALQSRFDEDIHYCMLQHERASVFLKYGFVIGEHSHADVMNFELFVQDEIVSRDISNSGYGSELFREWQRKTIAHNTVIVDRLNQPNRPAGKLLFFDAQKNSCRVRADDVYSGIAYERELTLLPDRLRDRFTIFSSLVEAADGKEHTFDWLFHCSGELACDLPFSDSQRPGEADGYQLMLGVKTHTTEGDWEISWLLPGKRLTLAMNGSPGTTIYLFKGYEHRSDLQRWGVMVRRSGSKASFEAEYRFALAPTEP